MISFQNRKQEGIILMITSFNQLYNFLSFFHQKKLMDNKKIYLTIFSDHVPEELILNLKQYIEKFVSVEVLDMRPKTIKPKIKFFEIRAFRLFYYYIFIFKKIFQLKKSLIVPFFTVSKIYIPTLFFIFFFSSSKFFLIEDGVGEYVPRDNYEKKSVMLYVLKKFLKINKSNIRILKLSKPETKHHYILNLPFLKKEYLIDNRKLYVNFIRNNFEKKLPFKPKCIVIGTNPLPNNINYYKNLYIKTLSEINKKYSYKPEQILFFLHPRTELFYREEFIKSLSDYSTIHPISSIIVEHYLSQKNLEIVIGSLSSALYYAKTIFNKNDVYHLADNTSVHYDHFVKVFESAGVKNFFKSNKNYEYGKKI